MQLKFVLFSIKSPANDKIAFKISKNHFIFLIKKLQIHWCVTIYGEIIDKLWSANDFYYCLIKFTAIKLHSHSHNKILLIKNIQRHSHVNTHCCTIYRRMPTQKHTHTLCGDEQLMILAHCFFFWISFFFLIWNKKKHTQRTCELVSGLIELSTTMAGNSVWKFIAISIIKRMAI